MVTSTRNLPFVSGVALLSLFLIACGGDDDGGAVADGASDSGDSSMMSRESDEDPSRISDETSGTMATFRFAHLHEGGAEDLDVRIAGESSVLFDELGVQEASLPTEAPAGSFAFEFTVHEPPGGNGGGGQVVATSEVHEFIEGRNYSVTLYNGADGPEVLVFEDDLSIIGEEETRLRGIHAAPGVSNASVSLTPYRINAESRIEPVGEAMPFVSDLAYRGVSQPAEFEGLLWYLISVDITGDGETDMLFRTPSPLTPGFNTNAYIMLRNNEPVVFAHVLNLNAVLPVPVVDPADIDEPSE